MFDERRPEVVRDAKRAVHDTSHPSDPLFSKRDQRALPEGHDGAILTEPEMEPVVDLPADVQSPEELPQLVEAEDPNTVSHVRSVLAAEATTPQPRTPELQPVAVQGCRVYPLFDLAAQRAQKRAAQSRWACGGGVTWGFRGRGAKGQGFFRSEGWAGRGGGGRGLLK